MYVVLDYDCAIRQTIPENEYKLHFGAGHSRVSFGKLSKTETMKHANK